MVGGFSLAGGFTHDKKAFFVLRALAGTIQRMLKRRSAGADALFHAGIGAALTVPSALSLIIEWFPEPHEQHLGIALFGGCGGLGNGALISSLLDIFLL